MGKAHIKGGTFRAECTALTHVRAYASCELKMLRSMRQNR